jgi:hypothetical protein
VGGFIKLLGGQNFGTEYQRLNVQITSGEVSAQLSSVLPGGRYVAQLHSQSKLLASIEFTVPNCLGTKSVC